ncbi:hypothetical protein Trydic_g10224 [Trypoxylus dichotomus]
MLMGSAYAVVIVLVIGWVRISNCQPNTLFKITKLSMCDPKKEYPLMMKGNVRYEDGKQLLSGKSVFKIKFGENSDVSSS